ncbi:MAG TPA: hypothetical protein VEH04_09420 [Verrucomicrobiae bacterium]|nr:hypothetical protein [Verrucomicrobiae bacterium]
MRQNAAGAGSIRLAVASRERIESAINTWSIRQIQADIRSEVLEPEVAQHLERYEAINRELSRVRRPYPPHFDPATGMPTRVPANTNLTANYEELMAQQEKARLPIASVLERRQRASEEIRTRYTVNGLVAEYARDRFNVVADSSDRFSNHAGLLYQSSGEVIDITEGVLKLFQQKTSQ